MRARRRRVRRARRRPRADSFGVAAGLSLVLLAAAMASRIAFPERPS